VFGVLSGPSYQSNMGWQTTVVLSTLLALVLFSESSQGAPPENDHEYFMRSFREFGRKLFPVKEAGSSTGEDEESMQSRSGKSYADIIPDNNNHHSRAEVILPPPSSTSKPVATPTINTVDTLGLVDPRLGQGEVVSLGNCPAVSPLTAGQCAGAVSSCWSPGQADTDCPNFGLCCFDGCVNTCVDGPSPQVGLVANSLVAAAPLVAPSPVDKEYSFTYASDDSYRTETSDLSGNVNGEYQFYAGDVPFSVKYAAGSGTGFVVKNQAEIDQNLAAIAQRAPTSPAVIQPTLYAAASVYNEEPLIDPTTWIRSKSYDFGFQSAYGSREESADERGSVTGSYQILDAQGVPITVYYEAGAGIGFIVLNQDEVNARIAGNDPAAAAYEAAASAAATHQAVVPSGGATYADSIQPTFSDYDYDSGNSYTGGNDEDYYDDTPDKSYSFGYSANSGSYSSAGSVDRQEQANSEGFVKGHYSYLNNEGNEIRVEYIAGPGVGFVIQNANQLQSSVKKATADGAAKASVISHSVVTSGGGSSYSTSATSNAISAPTYSSHSVSVSSLGSGHRQVSSGGVGSGVRTKSTSGKRRKMVVRKKKRKNVPALPITSKKAGHRGYGHY